MTDEIKIAIGTPRLLTSPRTLSKAKFEMWIVENCASGMEFKTPTFAALQMSN